MHLFSTKNFSECHPIKNVQNVALNKQKLSRTMINSIQKGAKLFVQNCDGGWFESQSKSRAFLAQKTACSMNNCGAKFPKEIRTRMFVPRRTTRQQSEKIYCRELFVILRDFNLCSKKMFYGKAFTKAASVESHFEAFSNKIVVEQK